MDSNSNYINMPEMWRRNLSWPPYFPSGSLYDKYSYYFYIMSLNDFWNIQVLAISHYRRSLNNIVPIRESDWPENTTCDKL